MENLKTIFILSLLVVGLAVFSPALARNTEVAARELGIIEVEAESVAGKPVPVIEGAEEVPIPDSASGPVIAPAPREEIKEVSAQGGDADEAVIAPAPSIEAREDSAWGDEEDAVIDMPAPTSAIRPEIAPAPRQICGANSEMMRELDILVKELSLAQEKGDTAQVEAIYGKIRMVKEEINTETEECQEVLSGPILLPHTATPDAKGMPEPYEYEEGLIGIEEEEAPPVPGEAGPEPISESTEVFTEPTAVESGREITNYYSMQIGKVMAQSTDIDKQITQLKQLRAEIDELIEELIRSKDEIRAEDVQDLVEEITIKPKEIRADNVVVETTDKKIITILNARALEVMPAQREVVIRDEDLEVQAKELTIKSDGKVFVANAEVKVAPSEVIEKINVEPKAIELREENEKAVYKVKTQERRKLFGFIPVRMTKTITSSALDTQVLGEKLPWWSFLTTK